MVVPKSPPVGARAKSALVAVSDRLPPVMSVMVAFVQLLAELQAAVTEVSTSGTLVEPLEVLIVSPLDFAFSCHCTLPPRESLRLFSKLKLTAWDAPVKLALAVILLAVVDNDPERLALTLDVASHEFPEETVQVSALAVPAMALPMIARANAKKLISMKVIPSLRTRFLAVRIDVEPPCCNVFLHACTNKARRLRYKMIAPR